MREWMGPSQSDIFVPRGQEQAFCQRNGIEFRRLGNGVVLFGIGRQVSDARTASVNFTIPSGSLADPEGKEGLHHFMEHIVAKELGVGGYNEGVPFNAATSPFTFLLTVEGAALDRGRTRGIWSVLPKIRTLFTNPFYLIDDMQEAIQREKSVIFGEMAERGIAGGLDSLRMQTLLSADNTMFTNTLGTTESVQSFGVNDVYAAARSIFQPDGLVIGALTESDDPRDATTVVDRLEDLFGDYRETNIRDERPDLSGVDMLNPALKPGALVRVGGFGRDPQLTNVTLVWKAPLERYSIAEAALEEYASLTRTRLMIVMRQHGWGYSATTDRLPLYNSQLFTVNVSIPTAVATEAQIFSTILPQLQAEVFGRLGSDDVDNYVARRQDEMATAPMPAKLVYNALMEGLIKEGRVIDIEELKRRQVEAANTDHIMRWKDTFYAQKPAMISISL